jgi:hypothetical protein
MRRPIRSRAPHDVREHSTVTVHSSVHQNNRSVQVLVHRIRDYFIRGILTFAALFAAVVLMKMMCHQYTHVCARGMVPVHCNQECGHVPDLSLYGDTVMTPVLPAHYCAIITPIHKKCTPLPVGTCMPNASFACRTVHVVSCIMGGDISIFYLQHTITEA